eukprot:2890879-Heterocapsa_arctica.AAC.1
MRSGGLSDYRVAASQNQPQQCWVIRLSRGSFPRPAKTSLSSGGLSDYRVAASQKLPQTCISIYAV